MERLQKLIAQSGVTSRRKAEQLIVDGRVKVNGKLVTELGAKAKRSDIIMVDNKAISIEEKEYYVLYKPENIISSTNDEKDRDVVTDLIDTDKRIFPVGRLDFDTSGVLILTNDGTFSNMMTNPRHEIEKEYRVKVKGFLRKEESLQLSRGVMIDGYKTKRAIVKDVSYNTKNETSKCTIIITEGKYHQVKRMFEAVGHEVIKLKRVRFGVVTLDNMRKGEVRRLKPHEIKKLKFLSNK